MKALRRRLMKAQALADRVSPVRESVSAEDVAWVTSLGCETHIEDPAEIGTLDSETWIVRFTDPELELIVAAEPREGAQP